MALPDAIFGRIFPVVMIAGSLACARRRKVHRIPVTNPNWRAGEGGDLLECSAVFSENTKNGPATAGQEMCNTWGLFGMHGNVWEWCEDWHVEGSYRVGRGGCWNISATYSEAACRVKDQPVGHYDVLGFRVAKFALGK